MDQLLESSRASHVAFQPKALNTWNNLLTALSDELQPCEADRAKREQILQTVSSLLQDLNVDGAVRACPYGSFLSTMYSADSDLDIALVGSCRELQGTPPAELHTLSERYQAWLLGNVANMLEGNRLVSGRVQRILGARVPVLKFRHYGTNVECDITVARRETFLKPRFLNVLTEIEPRFAQLYRLIKLWACAHGLNDAAASTLNSWSLCMLVIFYLQQQTPALLPPLWSLLYSSMPDEAAPRVLQLADVDTDAFIEQARLGASLYLKNRDANGGQGRNGASLMELLAGFFSFYAAPFQAWADGDHRNWRVCPWYGTWRPAQWQRPYIFGVEDPFDDLDNAARAIGTAARSGGTCHYIAASFGQSLEVVRGLAAATEVEVQRAAFAWLFGPSGVARLPREAAAQLGFEAELLGRVQQWLAPRARQLRRADPQEVEQRHVAAFRSLLWELDVPCDVLCVEDWHAAKRAERKAKQAETERRIQSQRKARAAQLAANQASSASEADTAEAADRLAGLSLAGAGAGPAGRAAKHAATSAVAEGAGISHAKAGQARVSVAVATAVAMPLETAADAHAVAAAAVHEALSSGGNAGGDGQAARVTQRQQQQQGGQQQQQGGQQQQQQKQQQQAQQRPAVRYVPVYAKGQGPPQAAAVQQAAAPPPPPPPPPPQQHQQEYVPQQHPMAHQQQSLPPHSMQRQGQQPKRQHSGPQQATVQQHPAQVQQTQHSFLQQQQAITAAAAAAHNASRWQQQHQPQHPQPHEPHVPQQHDPQPHKQPASPRSLAAAHIATPAPGIPGMPVHSPAQVHPRHDQPPPHAPQQSHLANPAPAHAPHPGPQHPARQQPVHDLANGSVHANSKAAPSSAGGGKGSAKVAAANGYVASSRAAEPGKLQQGQKKKIQPQQKEVPLPSAHSGQGASSSTDRQTATVRFVSMPVAGGGTKRILVKDGDQKGGATTGAKAGTATAREQAAGSSGLQRRGSAGTEGGSSQADAAAAALATAGGAWPKSAKSRNGEHRQQRRQQRAQARQAAAAGAAGSSGGAGASAPVAAAPA